MGIIEVLAGLGHRNLSVKLPEGDLTFLTINSFKRFKRKSKSLTAFYKLSGNGVFNSDLINYDFNVPILSSNVPYTITSSGGNLHFLKCEYTNSLDRLFSTIPYKKSSNGNIQVYPIKQFDNSAINLVKIPIGCNSLHSNFHLEDFLVLRGDGILSTDNNTFRIKPNTVFSIPSSANHHFSPMSDIYLLSFLENSL